MINGGAFALVVVVAALAFVLLGAQDNGCVSAARGPIAAKAAATPAPSVAQAAVAMPLARVGKPAPDFEATAYVEGKGFTKIRLSDLKGKWVVLCFYPGDFTFV